MLPPCCLSGRRQVKDLRGEAATVARSNSGDHLRECYWLVDRRARLLAWARIVAPAAAKAALPSVFLVLAAQYESLTLPLAAILIVPNSLIASITGVLLRGQDNNILTQVGFIVLIGLAAKNAILIVEFAKQLEDRGRDRWAAAVEAARLRLRPILMTSLAFIFGVVPLVWATGAGAGLRQ